MAFEIAGHPHTEIGGTRQPGTVGTAQQLLAVFGSEQMQYRPQAQRCGVTPDETPMPVRAEPQHPGEVPVVDTRAIQCDGQWLVAVPMLGCVVAELLEIVGGAHPEQHRLAAIGLDDRIEGVPEFDVTVLDLRLGTVRPQEADGDGDHALSVTGTGALVSMINRGGEVVSVAPGDGR